MTIAIGLFKKLIAELSSYNIAAAVNVMLLDY
jgi:hypothetical protein